MLFKTKQKKLWPSEAPTDLKKATKSIAEMKGGGECFQKYNELKLLHPVHQLYSQMLKWMLDSISDVGLLMNFVSLTKTSTGKKSM
jgi:hypothetical protein